MEHERNVGYDFYFNIHLSLHNEILCLRKHASVSIYRKHCTVSGTVGIEGLNAGIHNAGEVKMEERMAGVLIKRGTSL